MWLSIAHSFTQHRPTVTCATRDRLFGSNVIYRGMEDGINAR